MEYLVLANVVAECFRERLANTLGRNGVQITVAQDVVDEAGKLVLIVGHGSGTVSPELVAVWASYRKVIDVFVVIEFGGERLM